MYHIFLTGICLFGENIKVFVLLFSKSKKGCDIIATLSLNETTSKTVDTPGCSLLDSSLISQYNKKIRSPDNRIIYDCKIIKCGDYIQAYYFSDKRSILNKDLKEDKISKFNIQDIDLDNIYKESRVDSPKQIMLSNAIRSNLSCQRIAKTNRHVWETFITLTFAENITDISTANKIFSNWTSNIRKLKPDFKYLAVPEFQKRGAVHYHILSNLGLDDKDIILKQQKKTGKAVKFDDLYDVKYWTKGFARVDFIKNDYKKIYSYICKYMTKDIDNKLFGKKRYFYSQNLDKPFETYLNLSNSKDFDYFMNIMKNSDQEYKSVYKDIYTGQEIEFIESLSSSYNIYYVNFFIFLI